MNNLEIKSTEGLSKLDINQKSSDNVVNIRKSILIVDDSIVVRSVLRTALVERNFDVISARDASDAIACMNGQPHFDLIITDFHMPGLDGAAFIERVRSHPRYKAVPVLVLTAGADDWEKSRAKDAGASGWIVKPFDTTKLAAAIHALVPHGPTRAVRAPL